MKESTKERKANQRINKSMEKEGKKGREKKEGRKGNWTLLLTELQKNRITKNK